MKCQGGEEDEALKSFQSIESSRIDAPNIIPKGDYYKRWWCQFPRWLMTKKRMLMFLRGFALVFWSIGSEMVSRRSICNSDEGDPEGRRREAREVIIMTMTVLKMCKRRWGFLLCVITKLGDQVIMMTMTMVMKMIDNLHWSSGKPFTPGVSDGREW